MSDKILMGVLGAFGCLLLGVFVFGLIPAAFALHASGQRLHEAAVQLHIASCRKYVHGVDRSVSDGYQSVAVHQTYPEYKKCKITIGEP